MKLSSTRFGNDMATTMPQATPAAETMPAAEATPAPMPSMPETKMPSMPEMPAGDKATFSGKNPKFGAIDTEAAKGIGELATALFAGGIKNPLNWIAASAVGMTAQDGIRTLNKLSTTNPIKESVANSLAAIGNLARSVAPKAPEQAAETIIKEVITTSSK